MCVEMLEAIVIIRLYSALEAILPQLVHVTAIETELWSQLSNRGTYWNDALHLAEGELWKYFIVQLKNIRTKTCHFLCY